MGTDFVLQVKHTIFWLNIGLKIYLDLYVRDFLKSTSKYFFFFYILVLFRPKHPILEVFFLLIKTPKKLKIFFGQVQWKYSPKYIHKMSLENFKWLSSSE